MIGVYVVGFVGLLLMVCIAGEWLVKRAREVYRG